MRCKGRAFWDCTGLIIGTKGEKGRGQGNLGRKKPGDTEG